MFTATVNHDPGARVQSSLGRPARPAPPSAFRNGSWEGRAIPFVRLWHHQTERHDRNRALRRH